MAIQFKYVELWNKVKRQSNEKFNMIVVDSWRHRFLVVKSVNQNGLAHKIGIKCGDRVVYVNGVSAPNLDLSALNAKLNETEILMCIFRKLPPIRTIEFKSDSMINKSKANVEAFLRNHSFDEENFSPNESNRTPQNMNTYIEKLNRRINLNDYCIEPQINSMTSTPKSFLIPNDSYSQWIRDSCFSGNCSGFSEEMDEFENENFQANKENYRPRVCKI